MYTYFLYTQLTFKDLNYIWDKIKENVNECSNDINLRTIFRNIL